MDEKWRDYFYKGVAVFLTVAMCILFFFGVFRFEELRGYAKLIGNILTPFVYGAVIAYLLAPICTRIETKLLQWAEKTGKPEKLRRFAKGLSILFSLLFFFLIIYALLAMVIPQLIASVIALIDATPGYVESTTIWLEKLVEDNPILLNYVEEYSEMILESLQNFAKNNILPNINSIISGVYTGLWNVVTVAKNLIIGVIVAVYLLNSRRNLALQSKMLVHAIFPPRKNLAEGKEQPADWIIREAGILNDYLGGFVKAKLVDSLIIGLICMVFTAIVDMPYAPLVSVVIGVTNIIPFFGPFIGAIPCSLLILLVSPVKFVYFVIFILVLQQFDGNILGPKLLGDNTHLSSFWVLFAILLFGGLFGLVGMVIGTPIFAFIYQLLGGWVRDRLDRQK
ncbi:MAG: AI-2E family transporter [Lachnospiraceae bacterium]|nr:AI-2E family transporter [Lachnospiraceae bacterium]